jgi:hypothetical protein
VSQQISRVLFEIRLCCSGGILHGEPGVDVRGSLWTPDIPLNRARLEHAVELGNRLYGIDTHWIEKRQA